MPGMSRTTALERSRLTIVAAITALLLLSAASLARPDRALAATDETVEAKILSLVNAARERRGLEPLRVRASLVDFAGDRADHMASTGVLKHPKCLPCMLDRRGISYETYGETIAWTFAPWGNESARSLFRIWKNSPPHWSILMSKSLDRIGIGVARRANGSTWAAAVLTG
jgi:uncharacterized protein YkwD